MNPFISTKTISQKLGRLSGIFVVITVSVYFFAQYDSRIFGSNLFNIDYLRASEAGLSYRLQHLIRKQVSSADEPSETRSARAIPVLVYHSVLQDTDEHNVSFDNFKDQMFTLKEAGWETVNLSDFFAFMRGEKTLPDKSFVITFDDGRSDSYYPVDPILNALDYEAAMAVIVGRMKSNTQYHLNTDDLQKMHGSGRWDIISHGDKDHDFYAIDAEGTLGHFLTNKLWLRDQNRLETDEEYAQRVVEELNGSKRELENVFKTPIISFAPPFGDYGQATQNLDDPRNFVLGRMADNYQFGFYQLWPGGGYSFNYPNDKFNFHVPNYPDDLQMIRRITILSDWTGEDLLHTLNSGSAKNIADISATPYKPDGWISGWGAMSFMDDGTLRIGADPTKTGGSVFLDGSYDWVNYEFHATLDWLKGTNVFVVARYQNDANYVSCSFGSENIQVKQLLEGESRVIAGVRHDDNLPHLNGTYGVRVQGRTIECLIDKQVVLRHDFLDEKLGFGGIGFKTWDPTFNNSMIEVKRIELTELSSMEN